MRREYRSDEEREQVISQSMALGFSREDAERMADYPDMDLVELDERTGMPRLVRGQTLDELTRTQAQETPNDGEDE